MNHAEMRDLDSQFDTVTINGQRHEISGMYLSHEQAVMLAFPALKYAAFGMIVRIEKNASVRMPEQQLFFGRHIDKFDGMIVTVSEPK